MILYGSTMSPFVRKVVAFAAEKGIELELKPIGLGDPDPGFRRGQPVQEDAGAGRRRLCLADSTAIIHYLEAKYPEPALIPADPQGARADDLVRRVRRHDPVRLRRQDVLQPRRRAALPRPRGDLAAADTAERDELPPLLDYLEGVIPESGYLVGDG